MSDHKSAQGSMSKDDHKLDDLREKLAAIEHQRWADWQAWCHKILRENCPSPELEKVLKRWDIQIETPYDELTALEKDSDREQVDRYWPLLEAWRDTAVAEARIDELESFYTAVPEASSDWIDTRIAQLQALTTKDTDGGLERNSDEK